MSKRIDASPLSDTVFATQRSRWKRSSVILGILITICIGVWWYAVPRRCQLVAEFSGQDDVTKISVNADGFLHVIPQRRVAQYRDWDGRLLAEYDFPQRKYNARLIAAISPDGHTVAMMDFDWQYPSLLRQWHNGRLVYEETIKIPADAGGFPVLVAQDNGDLVFILHNDSPLRCNYYDLVGIAVIRHGKVLAVQSPWKLRTFLAADGQTILPGKVFKQIQISGNRMTPSHPSKAVMPPASRMANCWLTTLSANATWSVVSDGDYGGGASTRRVTAWNLRTGKSWDVAFPQAVDAIVATITDDGQYMALRGTSTPAGNLAPLVQRLPKRTPLREALLASRPAILIYHSGHCNAMLPSQEFATMQDDSYDWQINVSPKHRKLLITDMRTIRLYEW